MKVALVLGHKWGSPGALAASGGSATNEYRFNYSLLMRVLENGSASPEFSELELVPVFRRTLRTLPTDIDAIGADCFVSMHANAANGRASGAEALFYHRSSAGRFLAAALADEFAQALDIRNRGPKPVDSEDRGGYVLGTTRTVGAIAEPFFIDNVSDLARALQRFDLLALAYLRAINGYGRAKRSNLSGKPADSGDLANETPPKPGGGHAQAAAVLGAPETVSQSGGR